MIVKKASGITEPFESGKLFRVLSFACENTSVDPNEMLNDIVPMLEDNMTSKQIQKTVIKYAADHITPEEPDYQFVAARLEMYALRKTVYGQFEPWSLNKLIHENTFTGVYDKQLLTKWTPAEVAEIESHIDHDRDFAFSYAGVMQFKEKYLVKDRSTNEIFETPQSAYMLIAMCLHQEEDTNRIQHVVDFYNAVSLHKLSLPTPIMAGVRTPTRQFSSCVKIEAGDSLDSINDTSSAVVNYISQRAGIGINGGAIRAEGSRVRTGEIRHTGVIPFWKKFLASVKCCSQGGVRGGAATITYPIWHLEAEKLLVLKNNKGVEENRIRHLDYVVSINQLMMERLVNNDYITLFSPHILDNRLYDAYFADPDEFKRIYEEMERDPKAVKKRVKAVDLFSQFLQERNGTGRIYPMFVDNVNQYGPYNEPIKQTNLCVEIFQPTYPLATENEEIALCTLAAYNLGAIESVDELYPLAKIAVRALDNLLDYQDYPVDQALPAKKRRALGLGVTNFAYFLAKNFVQYSDGSANALVHQWMEAMQFANIQASTYLAAERGPCEYFGRTKYAEGIMPVDRYNKNVDKLVAPKYFCDWDWLRNMVLKVGMRNSVLSAFMPCESSSQISNSTNGIEPPRALVSTKQSKDGVFNQVVPEVELLASEYELAWNMVKQGNFGYLTLVAIMQKFVDQGISANGYYDPSLYDNGKVPMELLMRELAFCSHYGIKSMYYANTRDGADGTEDSDCDGCKV
ncbi:ribonucleotide reductase large subunit [Vibrio phage D479]